LFYFDTSFKDGDIIALHRSGFEQSYSAGRDQGERNPYLLISYNNCSESFYVCTSQLISSLEGLGKIGRSRLPENSPVTPRELDEIEFGLGFP
jgi:hypothetical protein